MERKISKITSLVILIFLFVGCSTSNVYKNPITQYQTAVNKTILTIQPYFVQLNSVETEYQLYSALKRGEEWGTQHVVDAGIDSQQIAIRLSVLQLISDYASLLADIVNSTAPEDIKKAAETLGQNSQNLANTITKLNSEEKKIPDFGTPLAQIVNFVGKKAIAHKQDKSIEEAVLKAEQPLASLMEKLEQDLGTAINLRKEAFAGIATVRLGVFNNIRKTVKPEKIPEVINQIVALRANMEMIASVNVTSLMSQMKSTHIALVKFVKSEKTPTDVSAFTDRVDVFTTNVTDVASIVQSLHDH